MSAFEVGAFESAPPGGPRLDMPPFQVVLRGFDRQQVEAWGKELANQIQQERLRADQAEQALYRMQLRQPATSPFRHLGAHVGDVLEETGRSAEKMLLEAAQRAQEAIDAAAAEAAQIIAAAEHQATEIRQAAQQTLKDAQTERTRLDSWAREAAAGLRPGRAGRTRGAEAGRAGDRGTAAAGRAGAAVGRGRDPAAPGAAGAGQRSGAGDVPPAGVDP